MGGKTPKKTLGPSPCLYCGKGVVWSKTNSRNDINRDTEIDRNRRKRQKSKRQVWIQGDTETKKIEEEGDTETETERHRNRKLGRHGGRVAQRDRQT